ncbi:alanine racemase [Methylomarinovum caldicuralii]|uniref:Alanine racemase n=1 Tax=Methylomarinovum caldicuralii TaxID=438856 RepID=A0AAU9CMF0_9GAMM|nr:alanine racemase [Methylomarinovum caldicuralii]BCX82861.1 alanine racemase [Methylomarinovum caldicuralii]
MSANPRILLDADALRANLARVRALAPRAKVLAVVKADAYGHGLVPVARALAGADGFAVARVAEGIALRRAGIGHPVVVLGGFFDRGEAEACGRHRLDPVIHDPDQLPWLPEDVRPWIKFDSGMHRLGLGEAAFRKIVSRLAPRRPVLMTHLACADETDNPATAEQLRHFGRLCEGTAFERSCANSAAILAWPQSHGDWVRPGLMLYGISPFPGRSGAELGLRPAMAFRARLIAVRELPTGEAVGYGGAWVARRPTRLGVVAAGYGDGYPREVQPETSVWIGGRRAPVVGRVSMDLLTVDLTDHPGIAPGAEVELWGPNLPVEEIAACAGTIPYTLVCGVTARVARIETERSEDGARQGCL